MKLKLNIYKNQREIEKTYEAESYDLMWGTVEDVLSLLDVADTTDVKELMALVTKCIGSFKPLMKDIFEGLTDEELRMTKTKELVPIVVCVIKEAYDQMATEGKNVMRGQRK